MNNDDTDPGYSLTQLMRIRESVVEANDALALNEFRNWLARQNEQQQAIEDLRRIVDTLAAGHVASIEEVQRLQRAVSQLTSHQVQLAERQNVLAEFCDRYASRLEEAIKKQEAEAERLDSVAHTVADRD